MNFNADDGNRDLTGTRLNDREQVRTYNIITDSENLSIYAWIIRGYPGDGSISYEERSGVQNECIQYGTMIYLQNTAMDFRWLTGSRGGSNTNVYTLDLLDDMENMKNYGFILLDNIDPLQQGKIDYLKCPASQVNGSWIPLQYVDTGSLSLTYIVSMTTSTTTKES